MNRVRSSAAFKLAVWLLMACCTFGAALLGLRAVLAMPYGGGGDEWQSNNAFRVLCQNWNDRVATAVADQIALNSDVISYVERQQLEGVMAEYEAAIDPDTTNYRFRLMSGTGAELDSNLSPGEDLHRAVQTVYYASFVPGEYSAQELDSYGYYAQYYGWMNGRMEAPEAAVDEAVLQEDELYILEYGVAAEPQAPDVFHQLWKYCGNVSSYWMTWVGTAAVLLLGALLALAAALWCAGWKTGAEAPAALWPDRVYTEVWLLLTGCAGALLLCCVAEFSDPLSAWYYYDWMWPDDRVYCQCLMGLAAVLTALFLLFALLMRTAAVLGKTHTLVRSTLVLRFLAWVLEGLRMAADSLPMTWKLLVLFLVYGGFNFIAFTDAGRYNGGFILLWFLVQGCVLAMMCWWAVSFQRLCRGARAMAEGDMENRVDTHRMPRGLREHGEDLNNISLGLSAAVDEKMKSERFKAELITNVSHDLKTPLTSIINYVNLLKTTQQSDPKAEEYIDVLDRKSQRLKKLTEDLVEASKASTGVLKVEREKIGMEQLLDQALGEWEEKLAARSLTVVKLLPEGETWVYADGRHLWRVIDNLLSNCSKYAMEGTRVYLELTRGKGQVTLSVKNISREALTLPAERLMERFVRGEESRNTEGSGLGLSIARSLTELQGGTFALTADGDLFKAAVTLPQAN